MEIKKTALITGATSGIGMAMARKLAAKSYRLILTGRRKEKLEAIKTELEVEYKTEVKTLNFDVRKYEEVERHIGKLPEEWQAIDVLINNAGLALGLSPIHEGDIKDWDQMIDTNIKGLLYTTRLVSPWMIERRRGHIFNISSIAGKHVYPNGNVYCATKHAVTALSQAMRIDLLKYNIKVCLICPGAAHTEFSDVRFKGDKERAQNVYKGFDPLTAENIADSILFALEQPDNVNIQDISIMPSAQATGDLFHKE